MKQLLILIISLTFVSTDLKAQPEGVGPFDDAVPYSLKSPSNIYLTNRDAEAVKAFFTRAGKVQPDRIVPVDEGYYHGYRLCYSTEACTGRDLPARWIQVVTIDAAECLAWYEKHNPELLMAPFAGLQALSEKSRQDDKGFGRVYDRYKHLACRLYRQSEDHEGMMVNELALVISSYSGKIEMETNMMLASGGEGVMLVPGNSDRNEWELWMQCLEEIELVGYTTLIEYSDAPPVVSH